jgi:uridylate kinase
VNTIVKLSNTDYIYDKDPKSHSNAKPFKRLSWHKYRAMIENEWKPGSHAPFDPIAAKLASELSKTAFYLNGTNLHNVEQALIRETFTGTIIE